MTSVIDHYFKEHEVRPEFQKEFISLWEGWLGPDSYYKLDQVTESDWQRFNDLVRLISERYDVLIVNLANRTCWKATEASQLVQTYEHAMQKESSTFMRIVIPELHCVLAEEWDFTYILWHKDLASVAAISPLIRQARLHHFT